jgi:cobalt-precorrin-5B (C1)-methyltransferase
MNEQRNNLDRENMDWRYTVTGGKLLRRGYSTGSCAAAAAKAAVKLLYCRETVEHVEQVQVATPAGVQLTLALSNVKFSENWTECSVRKDAGDDPDITDGLDIYARAAISDQPGIRIKAGRGVGVVTKPGLQVAVGNPAINPVPKRMIMEEVGSVLPAGCGVEVEIFIPEGERLARKTMNARLGVIGGLSILGTSGLVEPMSEKSYEDTLALELKAVSLEWKGAAVLVTGNYGRKLALEYFVLPEEAVVKIGNLVGFALDRCLELGFEKVLFVGHIGKLIKVAAGIFNTHSRIADARFEAFAARAALLGAGHEIILKLREAVTTEDMVDILGEIGGDGYFDQLAAEVSERAVAFLNDETLIGTVLFNFRRGLLGCDQQARDLLEEFK